MKISHFWAILSVVALTANFDCSASGFLVVHQKSGSRISFPIDDSPVITFDGDEMFVGNRSFMIADIDKYTIDVTGGVEYIPVDASCLTIDEKGFVIINKPLRASQIKVFDIKGFEVMCDILSDDASTTIDMSNLSFGIYLVVYDSYNIKIYKR